MTIHTEQEFLSYLKEFSPHTGKEIALIADSNIERHGSEDLDSVIEEYFHDELTPELEGVEIRLPEKAKIKVLRMMYSNTIN